MSNINIRTASANKPRQKGAKPGMMRGIDDALVDHRNDV